MDTRICGRRRGADGEALLSFWKPEKVPIHGNVSDSRGVRTWRCSQRVRGKYPDAGGLNCSPCHSKEGWGHAIKPSRDCRPAETIWKEACFGQRPEGYGDLFLYVPEAGQIIRIAEGTGDNLLEEDMGAGYVDYIYYDQYMLDIDMPNVDGGMVLLDGMLREKYSRLADCIPDVLAMAYGGCLVGYIILG